MPRKKGWKKSEVKKGNRSAVLQQECKYDDRLDRTEELASLKTETQDMRQVHELVASKFANSLPINLPNKLPNDFLDSSCTETKNEEYGDIIMSRSPELTAECYENTASFTAVSKTLSENESDFALSHQNLSELENTGDSPSQPDTVFSTPAEGWPIASVVSNKNTEISRSPDQAWNSIEMVFGSFHQNDERFSPISRGFQCTANALSMLAHTVTTETYCTSLLDTILCGGDDLYCSIINKLKSEGKFVQPLLSLEEVPDTFNIAGSHFIVKKQPIVSGILVEAGVDTGLSTLHSALESAFIDNSGGLLTTGAICSALLKKREMFFFFDSHSHGKNGLSLYDGTSVLISFTSLEDVVAYLYAFYDSLSIDFNTQFDFLPVTVKLYDKAHASGDVSETLLASYFKDQNVRQQAWQEEKANNASSLAASQKASKKKSRKSYHQMYKRKQRKSVVFKRKECTHKRESRQKPDILENEHARRQAARQTPGVLAKERAQKQELRQKPHVLAREWIQRQEYRKKPGVLAKECAQKQESRQKPGALAKERIQRQESRHKPGVLAKECAQRQKSRKKPGALAKERVQKQESRQKPGVLAKECAQKQESRKKPGALAKECVQKQESRQKPGVLAKECAQKQESRKKPGVLAKECAQKQESRKKPGALAKECVQKQESRQKPGVLAKECAQKQESRKKPGALAKERVQKQESRQKPGVLAKEYAKRQESRKKPGALAKECAQKQASRQKPGVLAKERAKKQEARKNPVFKECERIKKHQSRQEKRKFEEDESDKCHKKCKIFQENQSRMKANEVARKKKYESIHEVINCFHRKIAAGPIFVCTCCHQTWFQKSVSALKKTSIPATFKQNYCTKMISVNNEEWICHTCLSALKDGKVPKLSVANGMKWPDKPPELDLYQLEERLIALRIPFMQIRELPRGGQYSIKGNVINVPVDIQPTVNSLPRPMDDTFTIAVQLKKKLSYKKVDFKENVRPLKVLTALHWLVNKSEMYKKSDIVVDDKWLQEVTNSAEATVMEFLENCNSQTKENERNSVLGLEQNCASALDSESITEGYDSDGFSEIDSGENVGNVDTLVDDANVESKCDQTFTFAPGEGQHPLSLYQDKDAEFLCFPTIYCGQRRIDNDQRQTPVHYSDIVKWELRSFDRRAAQSVPNIFFKHKKLQMKQISDKVNLAIRRCKNKGKTITAGEARDQACMDKLVRLDEGYYIFRQLRNSPAYLEARKKDIFAMIRQLSLPTWFMSLSAADTRWNDLLKMLAKLNDAVDYSDEDIQALTWQEKTKLVQKDPVTCSRYFDHRVQEFINGVLKSEYHPVGKITDFFYRVEFQQRGSPHIHMLVWIENSPAFEKNSDVEIIEFVDQYLTCSTEDDDVADLVDLQMHKHSKTCRKKGHAICRFGFPLPPLPRTMLLHPLDEEIDNYKRKYTELQKNINEYKDSSDITFDEFLETIVKMDFEDYIKCIRSSLNTAKIFLKRKPNEMRVNLFNKQILLGWKANLDIQIILEPYGCATYVVGYISKSQRGMSAQLDAAAKEARNGNSDLKKQVRHIGNVFSNCVEVSAQEAVFLVLQIPLTKATRDVVFINTSTADERVFLLKPKSILDELPPESTDIESDNMIQRYSKRPRQLQQFCLADYVSKVDIVYPKGNTLPEKIKEKNEDDASPSDSSDDCADEDEDFESDSCPSNLLCMTKNGARYKLRTTPKIVRYVRYNKKKDPENYYRERLMLFMPWRNEAKDLIGSFETYKAHYDTLKATIGPKQDEYEHNVEELDIARQMAETDEDGYDQIAPNAEQENREAEEEGVKEAEPFIYFNPDRVVEHRQYDIGIEIQATCSVPSVETNSVILPEDQYLLLLRSLNLRQREFFNHVIFWLKCKEEPLYAFLSGGAGVGKSVLIKALYQNLYRFLNLREGENPDDIRILLCAYTGKAAYNINGVTIASAFLKKFKQSNENLSADELNTFRVKYRHLKLIIIDEISMVGTSTLSFLDTRLQQLTGTKIPFGGISIIAVGDLYQLMPVCDKWIFSDPSKGASALAPNLWKDHFRMYELVDIMRQKDDIHFAQLLNRLRQNELTDDDRSELKRHTVDPEVDAYPKQAPHLFTENKFVARHNESVLNRLAGEKVIIPCHDTVVIANISAQKSKSLIQSLPEDSNKTANLENHLKIAVGMVYDITVNINVEDGLTNGSTCVAKYIERKLEGTDRPSIIWVLFDDPKIGCSTREKSLNRGLYSSNIDPTWTPIFDIERSFIYNFKTYQRIQFPLKPSAGKTVHKAQGSTVDEIVVDLSQSRVRKQPHIHYVALSRVRKLENLFILNLNEEALAVDEKVKVEMQRLQTEGILELCYTPLYKVDPCKIKVLFNNARSLHKHFHEIEHEPNVLSADVIGFAETRLCSRDENIQFDLNRFRLLRLDETQQYTVNRPYHGLALYVRECLEVQKIDTFHSSACEFILATLRNGCKSSFQVVIFYKYPKSSQTDLKNDMLCHLLPLINLNVKTVILGDFNLDANKTTLTFVDFMRTQFGCQQLISKPTTDSGSLIDLLFANCSCSSDVIEAYWTDHKLVYCTLET